MIHRSAIANHVTQFLNVVPLCVHITHGCSLLSLSIRDQQKKKIIGQMDLLNIMKLGESTPFETFWQHLSQLLGLLRGITVNGKQTQPSMIVSGLVQQIANGSAQNV